jgi:hypothetical protein
MKSDYEKELEYHKHMDKIRKMAEMHIYEIDGGEDYLSGIITTDWSLNELKSTLAKGVKVKEIKNDKIK